MLQRKTAVQSFFSPSVTGLRIWCRRFSHSPPLSCAILLFSGSTPAISWRLTWLETFLPLQVIEISHFLGAWWGCTLLLARSLQRRVDAAYMLTLSMLGAGIVLSLLKGFDYEEAIVLSIMFTAFFLVVADFVAKGPSSPGDFSPAGWCNPPCPGLFSVACFFSYRHLEYSDQLWWQFTLYGDAPRFLRAMLGVTAIGVFFMLAKLLRPVSPKHMPPQQKVLERVRSLILTSPETSANLALLGDKSFLFSQEGNAFIMYGLRPQLVSMSDPIGRQNEWPDLIWQFREICDHYNGWTSFTKWI